MQLLVGLGNPGAEYARHRHNIGFMAVDAVHRAGRFSPWKTKFSGLLAEGEVGGARCLLLKPQTYMNLSGQSVGEVARYYKIPPVDIIAFHDDLDLPPGRMRVKIGGGHGGHNGLRSLDDHLGKEYWRVRLGIGHPGDKALVHGWVLGHFAQADEPWLSRMLELVASHVSLLLDGRKERYASTVALGMQKGQGAR
jgi:peptidyl-tRNA hydrolase, PTH1 family